MSAQKIILFGAGELCRDFLNRCLSLEVAYVVDNDQQKVGQKIKDLEIKPPSVLYEEDKESILILITSMHLIEIKKQLTEMGFIEKKHFKGAYASFLKDTSFSIVSDDCWGGFIYKRYDLEYNTPFMWLYILDQDYLKLLGNLDFYLHHKLEFIDRLWEPNLNRYYPVGKIVDIHLYFNHYVSESDVAEKWNRRLVRFNWNNIIVKMAITNPQDAVEFERLPFKKKIAFTDQDYGISSGIHIKEWNELTEAQRQTTNFKLFSQAKFTHYIDIDQWLNSNADEMECQE